MPTGLSPAEDRRKSCFFTGKRGLCNPVKHQLKRQTGKHFHEVTCADGGAASGVPQLRSAKKVAFVQDGSLLNSSSYPGAGFCHW